MINSAIRRQGEQLTPEVLNIFGDLVSVKVAGNETGHTYTIIGGTTPPKGGPPLHKHLEDAETFNVIRGRFLFELDGAEIIATDGDVVHIPAGVVHLYQNIGDEPGELFLVVVPAGLDEFFIELDALLKAHAQPPIPEIDALHTKYKMQLLGPPRAVRA